MPKSAFFGTPPRSQDTPPGSQTPPPITGKTVKLFGHFLGTFLIKKWPFSLLGFPVAILYTDPPLGSFLATPPGPGRPVLAYPPRSWEAGFGIPPQVLGGLVLAYPPRSREAGFGIPPQVPKSRFLAYPP